jgi:hypothetical protein
MLPRTGFDRTGPPSRHNLSRSLACLLTGLVTTAVSAQSPQAAKPVKLFRSDDPLAVTMTAPWGEIQSNESYQDAYPAQLRYLDASGGAVSLDMTVERRGIKRQQVCSFPPIKLRFDKDAVRNSALRGQKSLKLVTHCEKSERFDQYYVLEMLAYRMYNLLTDYSFRVRPLQVSYVDSGTGKPVDSRFAFLIEDDSDVAKRNDLKKIDLARTKASRLDARQSSLFALFQYMIGNVDWAATSGPDPTECCHNVKLIGPEPLEAKDLILPVPYDFDSAGLVDAPYAAPPNGLPIKSVTQRLYRGYCRHNPTLDAARQHIQSQEAALQALIESEDQLTPRSKKKASRYLQGYFEIAGNPGKFQKYIIERCRR